MIGLLFAGFVMGIIAQLLTSGGSTTGVAQVEARPFDIRSGATSTMATTFDRDFLAAVPSLSRLVVDGRRYELYDNAKPAGVRVIIPAEGGRKESATDMEVCGVAEDAGNGAIDGGDEGEYRALYLSDNCAVQVYQLLPAAVVGLPAITLQTGSLSDIEKLVAFENFTLPFVDVNIPYPTTEQLGAFGSLVLASATWDLPFFQTGPLALIRIVLMLVAGVVVIYLLFRLVATLRG